MTVLGENGDAGGEGLHPTLNPEHGRLHPLRMQEPLLPTRRMRVTETLKTIRRILFRRRPLSCPPEHLSCNPFFVVGAGRSGNTLLRAMLMALPEVSIPPESYVLPSVIRKFHMYDHMLWEDLVRLILSEFEEYPDFALWEVDVQEVWRQAAALDEDSRSLARILDLLYGHYAAKKKPEARRWGDKTPLNTLHIERLNWVFPQSQFVHIIRDGRDVVASYLESGIYKDLPAAASRWATSVARARTFGSRIPKRRYSEVRYERLVREPAVCLQEVCAFLDLQYRPEMLDFWQAADALGDAGRPHHANLHNPVNPTSIGRWRRRLDAAQQQELARLLADTLETFGYTAS